MDAQQQVKALKRKWLRRSTRLLALLACGLAAVFLILQFPWTKARLLAYGTDLASESTSLRIDADGLTGWLPFDVRLRRLRVFDEAGECMALENLRVVLRGGALLGGRIHVETISATTVTVARLPEFPPEASKPPTLPEVPKVPGWFRIDQAEVVALVLGPELIGESAILEARAVFAAMDQVAVHMERTDLAPGKPRTTLAFQMGKDAEGDIHLALNLQDATFFPRLTKSPDPLLVTLQPPPPGTEQRYELKGMQGDRTLLDAALRLSAGPPHGLALEGHFDLAGLPVPAAVSERLGTAGDLALDMAIHEDLRVDVREARVGFEHAAASAAGAYHLAEGRFAIDAEMAAQSLNRLVGKPLVDGEMPLRLAAHVEGMRADLRASVRAQIEESEQLQLDFSVTGDNPTRLEIEGTLAPRPPLVPAELFPMLEGGFHVAGRATYRDNSEFDVEGVVLEGLQLNATLEGRANAATRELDLALSGTVADFSPIGVLIGEEASGEGEFDVQVQVGDAGATLESTATLHNAAGGPASAALLTLISTVEMPDWRVDPLAGLTANAHLEAQTLTLQDHRIERLVADADVKSEDGETLQLSRFDLSVPLATGPEELRANNAGEYALADGSFSFNGEIVLTELQHTLARVLPPDAPEISGTAVIRLQASREADGAILLSQTTTGDGLQGLPPALDALLGPNPRLAVEAELDAGRFTTRAMSLEGQSLQVHGNGSYDAASRAVEADLKTSEVALAPLWTALNQDGTGEILLAAHVSGTMEDLALDATLGFAGLGAQGVQLGNGTAHLTAAGLPLRAVGSVDLQAATSGEPLNASTRFAYRDNTLEIRELDASLSERNRITGNAMLALEKTLPTGELSFTLHDLAAIGNFVGLPLAGSLEGEVKSDADKRIRLALDAENITTRGFGLAHAEIRGDIEDPFASMAMRVRIEGTGLTAPAATATEFQAALNGDRQSAAFDVDASGTLRDDIPFHANSAGEASLESGTLRIARLETNAGAYPIALSSALQAARTENGFTLDEVALRVADGEVRVSAVYDKESIAANGFWKNIPLEVASLVTDIPVTGRSAGTVALDGPAAMPRLSGELSITELRGTSEAARRAPPVQVAINCSVADGVSRARVLAAMEDAIDIDAEASLPIRFAFAPYEISLDPDAPLEGSLRGDLDLSAVPLLLGLDAHRLEGKLESEYQASGPLSGLHLEGVARIDGGRYENTRTSTLLEELSAEFRASGDRLVYDIHASDGRTGTLLLTGEASLRAEDAFAFENVLEIAEARLAHRDDLSVTASARINTSGTAKGARVSGEVVLGPATIFVPEELPPAPVSALEVVEVNKPADLAERPIHRAIPLPIALDLRCALPGRVFLRGTGLFSEWQGDLAVKGTAAAPRITGELDVVRGDLQFLGRRFDLAESRITFNGLSPPAPILDIRGVSRANEIDAIVRLTGTPKDTEVILTSDPPLPRDEVLAYILFGTGLSEITPVQAIQVAHAAAILARGKRSFADSAKLPVDRISVHKGETPGETTLGIGRYISDTIYMELQQGMGRTSGKATVRVDLNRNLKVEADAGADAKAGIGVYWRKDY